MTRAADPNLDGLCRGCSDDLRLTRAAREFMPPRAAEVDPTPSDRETPGFRRIWPYTLLIWLSTILIPGAGHAMLGRWRQAIQYALICAFLLCGGLYLAGSLWSFVFFSSLFTLHSLVLMDARQRERAWRMSEHRSHVLFRHDRGTSLAAVLAWYLALWMVFTSAYQLRRVHPSTPPIFTPDLAAGDRLITRRPRLPVRRGTWVILKNEADRGGRRERYGCILGIPGDEIVWTGSVIHVNKRIAGHAWLGGRVGTAVKPEPYTRRLGVREYFAVTPIDYYGWQDRARVPLIQDEFIREDSIGREIFYRYAPLDRTGGMTP